MKPAEVYILSQLEPYKNTLIELQSIVNNTIKDVQLKFKWRLPFFYLFDKPLCYLNVNTKKKYVDIVFFHGHLIEGFETYLIQEQRIQVRSLRYGPTDSIDYEVLTSILSASVVIHVKIHKP
jgi:hypothetical protein